MGSNGNGTRARALALDNRREPAHIGILRDARREVLLALCESDEERALINESLLGWEERPHLTELIDRLARRVVTGDDREILRMSRPFRVLLTSAPPAPARDPAFEMKIAAAEAEEAGLLVLERAAWDARLLAIAAVREAKTDGAVKARTLALRQAEEAHEAAREVWVRAGRVTLRLQRERTEMAQRAAGAPSWPA